MIQLYLFFSIISYYKLILVCMLFHTPIYPSLHDPFDNY